MDQTLQNIAFLGYISDNKSKGRFCCQSCGHQWEAKIEKIYYRKMCGQYNCGVSYLKSNKTSWSEQGSTHLYIPPISCRPLIKFKRKKLCFWWETLKRGYCVVSCNRSIRAYLQTNCRPSLDRPCSIYSRRLILQAGTRKKGGSTLLLMERNSFCMRDFIKSFLKKGWKIY